MRSMARYYYQAEEIDETWNRALKNYNMNNEQYLNTMPNSIDWDNVSQEIKNYIAWEYKRGWYDHERWQLDNLYPKKIKLLPCPDCGSSNVREVRCEDCWVECEECGFESDDYPEEEGNRFIEEYNSYERK